MTIDNGFVLVFLVLGAALLIASVIDWLFGALAAAVSGDSDG